MKHPAARFPSLLHPLLALGPMVLAGCGAGLSPQLDPGEQIVLDPDEGLLALMMVADAANATDAFVSVVDFCDADLVSCFEAGPFERGETVLLLELPVGPHCMTRMVVTQSTGALGTIAEFEPGEQCTIVEPSHIVYPGTVVVVLATRSGAIGVIDQTELVREAIRRDHPTLADRDVVLREWGPDPDS